MVPNYMKAFCFKKSVNLFGLKFAFFFFGLSLSAKKGTNPTKNSVHMVVICAAYGFHVVSPQ